MDYQTLTQADLVELARQRVRELEIEHYRLRLRRADAQSQQEGVELAAQLADIEARHAVHVPPEIAEGAEGAEPGRGEPPAATSEPDLSANESNPDDDLPATAELAVTNGQQLG